MLDPSGALKKRRKKRDETSSRAKTCGVVERELRRKTNRARSQRLAVGGSTCWHPPARRGIERFHAEKRHPTDGRRSRLQIKPVSFTGTGACRLGSRDSVRILRQREDKPTNGVRIRARTRQERQRLVRIESPRANTPEVGWTDPLKRARRRETLGSSSSSPKPLKR